MKSEDLSIQDSLIASLVFRQIPCNLSFYLAQSALILTQHIKVKQPHPISISQDLQSFSLLPPKSHFFTVSIASNIIHQQIIHKLQVENKLGKHWYRLETSTNGHISNLESSQLESNNNIQLKIMIRPISF